MLCILCVCVIGVYCIYGVNVMCVVCDYSIYSIYIMCVCLLCDLSIPTNCLIYLLLKVLDPQHKEELDSYLQMDYDDVMPNEDMNVEEEEEKEDDDNKDHDDNGGSLSDSYSEVSESNSEDGGKVGSDVECEVDEEFRKEIKVALGDAALPSSEVCWPLNKS